MTVQQDILTRIGKGVGPLTVEQLSWLIENGVVQPGEIPAGELAPGSVSRSVADVLGERISAKSYLTLTDGSGDQATELVAAITAAEETGKPLWIQPDVSIRLDDPVAAGTGPLRIINDGRILLPADQAAFSHREPSNVHPNFHSSTASILSFRDSRGLVVFENP